MDEYDGLHKKINILEEKINFLIHKNHKMMYFLKKIIEILDKNGKYDDEIFLNE